MWCSQNITRKLLCAASAVILSPPGTTFSRFNCPEPEPLKSEPSSNTLWYIVNGSFAISAIHILPKADSATLGVKVVAL